jgi:uncharacterized protein YeaO (DUF488 family)
MMTMGSNINIKRVYDEPSSDDGWRVLVDRLWPRGLSKDKARVDDWLKDLAPSDGLRKWFGHDPAKWRQFRHRYLEELRAHRDELGELRRRSRGGRITLLFAARDTEHNNAVALRENLERRLNA